MLDDYEEKQPLAYNFLKKLIKKDKIHHAYLIETNGVSYGFDMAMALAKTFLCPKNNLSIKNCKDCYICSNIDNNNYPDLKIIETDKKVIKKEQLLELKDEFILKPLYGNYLIYIIKNAELLNKSSSNTILKFLEEPSENIIAILVTNSIYNCLDTIVSRCQILSLKNTENIIDDSLFKKYCNDADLDTFIKEEKEQLISFYINFEDKKAKSIVLDNPYIYKEKIDILLDVGLHLYMDVLNFLLEKPLDNFKEHQKEIEKIAIKNEVHDIIRKIDIINQFINNNKLNVNKDLYIDNFIIQLTGGIYD